MSFDLAAKTDAELKTIIENHEKRQVWGTPLLLAARTELDRRQSAPLDLDTTLRLILDAAREGKFISYKDVADQSGQPWAKVYRKVVHHIGVLSRRELPRLGLMPSVMVVGRGEVHSGHLDEQKQAGFEKFFLELNPTESLRGAALVEREQQKVFEHARTLLK